MEREITAIINEDEEISATINLEALKGSQGLSAYEIYLNNLSDGETTLTEQEWLDSLSKVNYYKQYKQTYVTTENNTTIVPILIGAYNATCLLDLYLNGLRLSNDEYSVDNISKRITFEKPINKEQTIHIIVSKTIVATAENFDLLKGPKGDDGVGVPNGGTTGQVLVKKSGNDYDVEWSIGGVSLLDVYPVGSIYMSVNSTNPSTLFGGTWEQWGNGRVPVSVDTLQVEFNTVEKTGGTKAHQLTIEEMPYHSHGQYVTASGTGDSANIDYSTYGASRISAQGVSTEVVGGGRAHNNMPPFITCYMWKRTD